MLAKIWTMFSIIGALTVLAFVVAGLHSYITENRVGFQVEKFAGGFLAVWTFVARELFRALYCGYLLFKIVTTQVEILVYRYQFIALRYERRILLLQKRNLVAKQRQTLAQYRG